MIFLELLSAGTLLLLSALPALVLAQTRVVLSNDDGWATSNIRALYASLSEEGYNVVLSAPAENQSGTGSLNLPPSTVGAEGCEFDSCPPGSPPTGQDASDPRLNYVNSFPATSVQYGITKFGPQFFDNAKPDIVISGPNFGVNTGLLSDELSGTIGAATEAVLNFGIPALAISGGFSTQTSYTVLDDDDDASNPATTAAQIYASLSSDLLSALLNLPFNASNNNTILPLNTLLNVNYPDVTSSERCASSSDVFEFVLTRAVDAIPLLTPQDVETCGSTRLPTESSIVGRTDGCFASVTVLSAVDKLDATADDQKTVLQRLDGFLSCA